MLSRPMSPTKRMRYTFVAYGKACRLHPSYDSEPSNVSEWNQLTQDEIKAHPGFHLAPKVDKDRLAQAVKENDFDTPEKIEKYFKMPPGKQELAIGNQPFAIAIWGGVCSGKSTVRKEVILELDLEGSQSSIAEYGQDEIVSELDDFKKALENRAEAYKYAYMDCVALAGCVLSSYHKVAEEKHMHVVLELQNNVKLAALVNGQGSFASYQKVLVFVDQREPERAVKDEEERAAITGRWMGPWCAASYGKWLTFNFLWTVHRCVKLGGDQLVFVKRRGMENGKDDARLVRIVPDVWHRDALRTELDTLVSDAEKGGLEFGTAQNKDHKSLLDGLETRARTLLDEVCSASASSAVA